MKTKHKCITYFKISGDFEPKEILDVLDIKPTKISRKGDKYIFLNQEKSYDFSSIEIGYNNKYNVEIDLMIEKTIKELRSKIKELRELKLKYPDIEYTLEVVPEINLNSDEPNPYISPTKEIMKFLVEIEADYDIDYYINNEDFYWSGRVFYEIKINDKHAGYEEVIQLIKGNSEDPLVQLEEIAKRKEITYVNELGENVEIKLFQVQEVYAIHDQDYVDSFEVYANTMPTTKTELTKYLDIAYNLDDETRELNVSPGARTDKKRR